MSIRHFIAYLTDHPRAATAQLCILLDVKPTRVRDLLRELTAEGRKSNVFKTQIRC